MAEDELQQRNNLLGDQLLVLIEQVHGEGRPFILIMPPLEKDPTEAQLVTNLQDIGFIQRTIRRLDESLSGVHELRNAGSTVQ